MVNKIITSFGSGLIKPDDPYYNEIFEIGKAIGKSGWTLCCGGFYGTMEAIAKGAKSAGGKTIGVTVTSWKTKCNDFIDEEVKMENLMERIMELIGLADEYLVFKGGTGTLVEFSVAMELMNKKMVPEKPIIFYGDFWKQVIELLKLDSDNLKVLIDRNVKFISSSEEILSFL
ncbi:MAG TPA: LOG family protein [Ignavibacteria bacterium]|jgi:hypothetical protein